MGTGGNLAAQALTLKLNQRFSEMFLTPATGFSGLDTFSYFPVEAEFLNGVEVGVLVGNQANVNVMVVSVNLGVPGVALRGKG